MSEHVILIHGIWMRSITLQLLARRLRQAGYTVDTLDYASVFGGIVPAIARLRDRVARADAQAVHLVGHSLGALVALETARELHDAPLGRIVCLGPPLRGSAVARAMTVVPGGRWLMGHSADVLVDGIETWSGPCEVGVIAGRLPLGLGVAIGSLHAPHDGTVSVEETRLDGIADHCTVATSHTGLLLSTEVAELTATFLRDGRFAPERA
jgi:pimeloyl-ACP methyl ester carboxylesterase